VFSYQGDQMAKKGFNLSAEVRELVKSDNELTGPEVYQTLSKKSRGINQNSCAVAFSKARRELGLTKKKTGGKRISKKVAKPRTAGSTDTVSRSALHSARELLSHTNWDVQLATDILEEVQALQG
jgi:hypothetical protein